ncbi:MAG: SDR family oxidoreductase [Polaribacter sp.]
MDVELSGKKILVTGGAGFIGSNLCEVLLDKKNTVICLDDFSTGKRENISSFLSDKNFKLIVGDIRNLADCLKATKGVDFVLHQAALGSVPRSIDKPKATNEVNISGFLNMLIAARDNKVKRFVYAASSSVYGDSEASIKVEDEIGKPLSPYAVTKVVNELYADVFSKTYGLETIGLRYFNVFGKKQDANGAYSAVIPKFISQFIDLKSPVINGDGSFTRDFTYIDNVVQANLLSIIADDKAVNNVYNIACGGTSSLLDLTNFLKKLLVNKNKKIENIDITFGPNRSGDIPHSRADISKAKRILNYNPKISLEIGLEKSIDWYWQDLNDL